MENQVTNNNDEIEIDLGEIFHLILSRLGLIILSGIILGVISIIGTMLFITPQYESTTKIMVLNKQDSNTLTSADMQTSTQLTKDYAELIKSRTVLEGVIAQLNLNITYQQLLGKLTVDTSTDSRIAMAIVIIIYLTNDTIKVEEDVERYLGLSVLGSIPYSEKESRSKKQKSRKRR